MRRFCLLWLLPLMSVGACAGLPLNPSSEGSQYATLPNVIADAKGNVLQFYGVPIDLTISDVQKLPYSVKIGEEMEEGLPYPIAEITAINGVEVRVVFSEAGLNGKLYSAETTSPNAVGPRGIGVGSALSEVKAAWPAGRLDYGRAHGPYVTFITGANVYYEFNTQDMPRQAFDGSFTKIEIPNLRVQGIRLRRLR